jgi:hypothetical protein
MIRRLVAISSWLIVGHAVLAGLYYGLLNVPESSIWMLATSAVLCLAIVALGLYVHVGGIGGWLPDRAVLGGMAGAWRHIAAAIPAVALLAVAWWAGACAGAWHAAHRGEIDAALMARFNWAETAWVHEGWNWVLFALRNAVALSLALAWVVSGVTGGLRELARPRWIVRGLDPRAWGSILVVELLLVVLPWHFVFWRPASLPPTRAELAFAGAKLAVMAIAGAVGWAIVLGIPVWRATRSDAPPATPLDGASPPPVPFPPPEGPLAA